MTEKDCMNAINDLRNEYEGRVKRLEEQVAFLEKKTIDLDRLMDKMTYRGYEAA